MSSRFQFITRYAAVAVLSVFFLQIGAGGATAQVQDGTSNTVLFAEALVGVVPQQKARMSCQNNLKQLGIAIHAEVLGPAGDLLARTEEVRVPAGEFRYLDVAHGDLNVEGEPETGRVQVRVRLVISAPPRSKSSDFMPALDLVNEETGATAISLVFPAVQAARQAAR